MTRKNRWEFVDDTKEAGLSKKFVPKNTATSTRWAMSNLFSWCYGQKTQYCNEPYKQVPVDLILAPFFSNFWTNQISTFCHFVMHLTIFFESCSQKESILKPKKHRPFRKRNWNQCGKLESCHKNIITKGLLRAVLLLKRKKAFCL